MKFILIVCTSCIVTQLRLNISGHSIYNYKIGGSYIVKVLIYLQLYMHLNKVSGFSPVNLEVVLLVVNLSEGLFSACYW